MVLHSKPKILDNSNKCGFFDNKPCIFDKKAAFAAKKALFLGLHEGYFIAFCKRL